MRLLLAALVVLSLAIPTLATAKGSDLCIRVGKRGKQRALASTCFKVSSKQLRGTFRGKGRIFSYFVQVKPVRRPSSMHKERWHVHVIPGRHRKLSNKARAAAWTHQIVGRLRDPKVAASGGCAIATDYKGQKNHWIVVASANGPDSAEAACRRPFAAKMLRKRKR
jgi:hypothetical protein